MSALIEELSHDPILSHTKLIAEPWDLGVYQLGEFSPHDARWSEWNGKYRDAIRKFIKGDPNSKNEFAARIAGSQDIFPARKSSSSINFVTAHDGFTLHDLVSYNDKHNEINGEHNRDGNNQNLSWNMGYEGETDNPDILHLRNRQMKNFMVALLLSRGVPMLFMGDEYGHTKNGNNNTWCHDNELNWFLWDHKSPFTDFVRNMIRFRKEHPLLQEDAFYEEGEIIWHGMNVEDPNWQEESPIIAFTIIRPDERHLYVAFNATPNAIHCNLPEVNGGKKWHQIVNTHTAFPDDFLTQGKEKPLETLSYTLESYSSIILKML
jgi:glycogen debranching enzyme GlgX